MGVDEFDPSILADGMGSPEIRDTFMHPDGRTVQRALLIYEEPTFGCYWSGGMGTLTGPCVTPDFDPNDPSTFYSDEYATAPGFYNYVGGGNSIRGARQMNSRRSS